MSGKKARRLVAQALTMSKEELRQMIASLPAKQRQRMALEVIRALPEDERRGVMALMRRRCFRVLESSP